MSAPRRSRLTETLASMYRRSCRIGRWVVMPDGQPSPGFYKRWVIRKYARQARTPVLVETGTLHGTTVRACATAFDIVISVEIDRALARSAAERFARFPHVRIIEGDSAAEIPTIVNSLSAPTTFWLDGHYSGPGTGRGESDSPIIAELTAVLRSTLAVIVLIDDARMFVGCDGYPTIEDLKDVVVQFRPTATMTVSRDIIRIDAMRRW